MKAVMLDITQLCDSADRTFFRSVLTDPFHSLHPLINSQFPPLTSIHILSNPVRTLLLDNNYSL